VARPLYVAIVWHMHQPYYRHPASGLYELPWVRLHGARNYLRMADLVGDHPGVHVTFNLVPCLLEQLAEYAAGKAVDRLMQVAAQDDFSRDDKKYILNICHSPQWQKTGRRQHRYTLLQARRQEALAYPPAFTLQDYRDLIAWFNLSAFDLNWLERDERLQALVYKERNFTTHDLAVIHAVQQEIIVRTIPRYKELQDAGQIELTTTPYYHPILPLLVDTECAQRASPGLPLPVLPLRAPEDAEMQLRRAYDYHRETFGRAPIGLWPSEGSVSPEVAALAWKVGFRWLASDEAILGRSLNHPFERDENAFISRPTELYAPYRILLGGQIGPSIIFRDHELSDRIGFLYTQFPGTQAAENLVHRLLAIRERLPDDDRPYLVSIILDGENAWEYYERNGDVFLHVLYGLLERRTTDIQAVTVSEFMEQYPARRVLAGLATGSWIGGDLTTWIGDPAHTRAWEALSRTRADLLAWQTAHPEAAPESKQATWRTLYVAEGSDWFWWYSKRNRSDQDMVFDAAFRANLAQTYVARGENVPEWLNHSIYTAEDALPGRPATGYIRPRLTAAPYPPREWDGAGVSFSTASTGTMQRAEANLKALRVGYNAEELYIRLDMAKPLPNALLRIYLTATGNQPYNHQIRFASNKQEDNHLGWELYLASGAKTAFLYRAEGNESWQPIGPQATAVADGVVEIALTLSSLGLALQQEIAVFAVLGRDDHEVERIPLQGIHQVKLIPYNA
jgi:alpha-amylase/alpha-mannosidase (GH57 family)